MAESHGEAKGKAGAHTEADGDRQQKHPLTQFPNKQRTDPRAEHCRHYECQERRQNLAAEEHRAELADGVGR